MWEGQGSTNSDGKMKEKEGEDRNEKGKKEERNRKEGKEEHKENN